MKPAEEAAFEKVHGFRPTCISVALDCLAVYVHKDNPLHGLTLAQLDCIFSKTRKSGFQDIVTWGDADLTGAWAKLPITLYGRNTASGTYAYFKQFALLKGDYKDNVQEQPDSAAVVQHVANDRAGIGYSSLSFKTDGVRALPLTRGPEGPLAEPTFASVLSGSYPLGRTLYIYVAKKPGEHLPIVNEEFLRFVLSKQGQEMVEKAGYGALPHDVVKRQLELLK
jgi:phosphate transport system substrate-binding protein